MLAQVYVEKTPGEASYTSRIRFMFSKPLELRCVMTRADTEGVPKGFRKGVPPYVLSATLGGKPIHPDDETYGLLEHLTLVGADHIRYNPPVDIIRAQCGGRTCSDDDLEIHGEFFVGRKPSGTVVTKLNFEVSRYLRELAGEL